MTVRPGSTLGLLAIAACGGRPATIAAPAPASATACAVGDTAMVRDVVYFGRNRPGGGTVSDADWRRFLDEVVTPRFPHGLTVVDATGQWRGQSGVVEQERSEIVTVFHSGDATSRRAIADFVGEYKRQFQQEAVLRERSATCARFE